MTAADIILVVMGFGLIIGMIIGTIDACRRG